MLPQILSADPLPPAGVASARRTPHSFLVLPPVSVAVLAAHRDQHRTVGVAALGTLFIWHRITLLSTAYKKRRKEILTTFCFFRQYKYSMESGLLQVVWRLFSVSFG
jgi:hypothetical protein